MKRILLASMTATLMVIPTSASAQTFKTNTDLNGLFTLNLTTPEKQTILLPPKKEAPEPKPVEQPKPQPAVYTVIEGDNLTKIGSAHNVEWQRLWAKNTQLTHPDQLKIGDVITVPLADEILSRDIPAAVQLPTITPGVVKQAPTASAGRSYDAGNTYDYGYCTWYVKNRRGASLPNSLGNANTWYSRAWDLGMAVGSTPRAGAVGTTTRGALGHVVYVESVNGDGSINISEMNAPTWGAVTYRTANANEFSYIY